MSSSNYQSVIVVGVIFLVAVGSVVYISHFGESKEDYIVATVEEIDTNVIKVKDDDNKSRGSAGPPESGRYFNEERTSIIDCENMVPPELQTPRFLGTIPNVTVSRGDNASIVCVVENLGQYRMAWLKLHSQTILTIHKHVITKNRRIELSIDTQAFETPCKNRSIETTITMYTLHINSAQKNDEGFFMCQMNTDPMKGQWGYLKVEVPENPTELQDQDPSSEDLSALASMGIS